MRNKVSNLIWGLIFIVIGVGIAGNAIDLWDFKLFFPGWWTLFIIVPCLASVIRSGFSTGSTTGLIIGSMLLLSHYIDLKIDWWDMIVPAILIIIGVRIIFQGAFNKTMKGDHTVHIDGQGDFRGTNRKEYSAIFAGNKVRITDQFTGTGLNAVFGGITLDLREAIINGDVEIAATAVFGGIDIYVPSGVRIKVNNIPIFGGVSNKAFETSDPNAATIYLNSTTMFGGIDIK